MVPQHGHGAVGEAAPTLIVTDEVTLTCSMIRSERSGSIVIGSYRIKKLFQWKFCSALYFTTLSSASLRKNQIVAMSRFVVLFSTNNDSDLDFLANICYAVPPYTSQG